jgi:serine/threonine-protein kinase
MDATPGDPMVGRLLEGRYAIESFIAHGGMASVYLATDTRLERRVAVKVLHAHLASDHETLARFQREARAAARLSHPNVVAVYDQGTDGDRPFLVMEYVPGATLRHVLRDRGVLTPAEALTVMDHVLAALGAAHSAGLVHRDIKPENVLLTSDGRVKVADFGLARAVAGSTVTTTGSVLFGTAAYLSPEQFQTGTADERSDVYSAGIVFFELLTGRVPFEGDSAYAVLHRHAHEDVPAPSTRTSGIPPQVDALVTWATSRDPAQRPADAGELHASLLDVRDKLGLHAAVPGLPTTTTTRLAEQAPPAAEGTGAVTRAVPPQGPPPPAGPTSHRADSAPRRRRWHRPGPLLASGVLLAVIVAAILGWYFAAGRYTHVPKVLGDSQQAAIAQLKHSGLHVKIGDPVHSIDIAKGKVAVESPSDGSRITHGGTVVLHMSLGPQYHRLPSLAGDNASQATAALQALHISVSRVERIYETDVSKGFYVKTDPAEGDSVPEGSSVVLYISKGPKPVAVPDVTGLSVADATTALRGQGLLVDPSGNEQFSNTVPAGDVITTHPAPNTTKHEGSTVHLVVSKGPRLVDVPNVVGQNINDAVQAIKDAGLTPNAIKIFPGPGGEGRVDRETPTGKQPHGATINLYYY